MNIQIQFLHDCILIEDILVIGDLHIGCDEYGGKVAFSGLQLKEIINKLDEIFLYLIKNNKKIKKIILLGDVKHDFGTITDIEWRGTLKLFDFLKGRIDGGRIVIIKGNHDTILEPVVKKRNIKLKDYFSIKIKGRKMCFMHGNRLFKQCLNIQTNRQTASTNRQTIRQTDKQSDRQIIFLGHLHPAITLYDKYKSEKYKCFLRGRWKNKDVYILPSFSNFSYGYELNDIDEDYRKKNKKKKFFMIPSKNLKNFEVIIYNNKEKREYNFGRLKELNFMK